MPAAFAQADGTLTGTLNLSGIDSNAITPAHPINFEFMPSGGGPTVFVKTIMANNGNYLYTITNIPAGTYDIGVSVPLWLRTVMTGVVIHDGMQTTQPDLLILQGGDTDSNGVVDVLDFGNLVSVYGTDVSIPGGGYDPTCDFNWDGRVDTTDFGILVNSYGAGASQGIGGVLYPINLIATPSAGNVVTLTWNAPNVSGGGTTTYTIYRSITPDHGSATSIPPQTSNTYMETLTNPGPYYYQIVATTAITNGTNTTYSYGLSNEAVVSSNPLIENFGNRVFRITGFQSDRMTVNYQALVTNGLLNSYQVNGNELFHGNVVNGLNLTIPMQFAPTIPYAFGYGNLASGQQTHSLPMPPSQPTSSTLNFTIVDGNKTTGINYTATPVSLQMEMQPSYPMSFALPIGCENDAQNHEAVVAAQNLNVAGQGFYRFPGDNTIRALPLTLNSTYYLAYNPPTPGSRPFTGSYNVGGVRNLRCLFGDGSGVDFTYALNDPAFSGDAGHLLTGQTAGVGVPYSAWGRDFGTNNILFTFSPVAATSSPIRNSAPPFHLYIGDSQANVPDSGVGSYDAAGLHATTTYSAIGSVTNKLYAQIQIDPSRIPHSGDYTFTYQYTDFWDKPIPAPPAPPYSVTVHAADFNATTGIASLSLFLPGDAAPITGWFHLVGNLAPAGATGTLFANQDATDLGVYTVTDPNGIKDLNGMPISDQSEGYLGGPPAALSGVLGHSDPALPRLLGSQSNRVDCTVPIGYDPSSKDAINLYAKLMPRNESVLNSLNQNGVNVSQPFDRFAAFSDPGGQLQDEVTLVGSITPLAEYDGNGQLKYAFGLADVGFSMAAALTYAHNGVNTNSIVGANSINYWSLDNEPGTGQFYEPSSLITQQMSDYIRLSLHPGVDGVSKALTTPSQYRSAASRVTPNQTVSSLALVPGRQPIFIGPNPVRVEQNIGNANPNTANYSPSQAPVHTPQQFGPLSWWEVFFGTNYIQGGNTYYAMSRLDAVGVHTYTGDDRSWEEHGVYDSLITLQNLIKTAPGGLDSTGKPKPLWITEHGWNWINSADMPRLQGDYIVRRYALAAAAGIPHKQNLYYYAADVGFAGNFQYLWDGVPNRGAMAMRILNEKTAGMSYDKTLGDLLKTGPYVHAIPYTGNGAETLVIWGNDFTDPQKLNSVNVSPPQTDCVKMPLYSDNGALQIYDIMGGNITAQYLPLSPNTTANPSAYYLYKVPATGSPVYVVGQSGNHFEVGRGWPTMIGEKNFASRGEYATALATSSAPDENGNAGFFLDDKVVIPGYYNRYLNGGAGALNDGVWGYDDMQSNGQPDFLGNPTKAKTIWIGDKIYSAHNPFVPASNTDAVTVMLAGQKTIDTVVAVVPSSNNSTGGTTCGVRDYWIQILTPSPTPGQPPVWSTIKQVQGNTTEWVLYATVPSALQSTVMGVRLQIININNGRWYDDYNAYKLYSNGSLINGSPLRAMAYELKAWGPQTQ